MLARGWMTTNHEDLDRQTQEHCSYPLSMVFTLKSPIDVGFWFMSSPRSMIPFILFFLITPFPELSCPVNVGRVVQEGTTPIIRLK